MKVLILPDAHAHPEHDNDRFKALGEFILAERPDRIVCLGDFADMPSLSHYDKGTRGFEGKRYNLDVEATREALELLHAPITDYNRCRRIRKEKQYLPQWDMCLGNHEERIDRAANSTPELHGTLDTEDLGYQEYGWTVHPFKEVIDVEGFAVSHHFASGAMGRPIGGANQGRSMLTKLHSSCIAGHSHLRDFADSTRPNGDKILGIVGGCYSHPTIVEGFAANTAHMWWRGITILEGACRGNADEVRFVDQDKILREYL